MVLAGLFAGGCGEPPPLVSVPRVTVTTRVLRTLPPELTVPTSAAPPEVAVPPTVSAGPEPTAPTTRPPEASGTAFCNAVRRYTSLVNQLNASPTGDELRQLVIDVTRAIEAAAVASPPSVKADTAAMATAHRRFLTALEAAGFDPGALDPAAGGDLQSASYLAARTRVRDYNRANC